MSTQPYLGEIVPFAGNFPPKGYAFCNGQLLSIAQNTALFSLLGTTYGGNGQTTFALPDLQGRHGVHRGQGPGLSPVDLGEVGGVETVTLTAAEVPPHAHQARGAGPGDSTDPAGRRFAVAPAGTPYGTTPPAPTKSSAATPMRPGTIVETPPALPHDNRPPYLVLSFIIAVQGVFPQRP